MSKFEDKKFPLSIIPAFFLFINQLWILYRILTMYYPIYLAIPRVFISLLAFAYVVMLVFKSRIGVIIYTSISCILAIMSFESLVNTNEMLYIITGVFLIAVYFTMALVGIKFFDKGIKCKLFYVVIVFAIGQMIPAFILDTAIDAKIVAIIGMLEKILTTMWLVNPYKTRGNIETEIIVEKNE